MGLFFNTKSSSGSTINRKRVSSNDYDRKDVSKLSKSLNFTKSSAREKFTDIMMKAESGGWTREEVHAGLQEMILSGKTTKAKARDIAKKIGLEQDRFRKFKDISESQSSVKNKETIKSETVRKDDEGAGGTSQAGAAKQKISTVPGNTATSLKLNSNYSHMRLNEESSKQGEPQKKPGSIWDILNNMKH